MSTDTLTKAQRRKTMQAIKPTGSKIEKKLQKVLWQKGYRYRKNYKKVTGKPDIAFVRLRIAVFVDSEFWHGYDWVNRKFDFKSNKSFWLKKIEKNMTRDIQVTQTLKTEGWIVLRFWGNDINKNADKCAVKVERAIKKKLLEKRENH